MSQKKNIFPNESCIYGPVKSWRFGMSVGIDVLYLTSTCSFNCLYCQLGKIQNITTEFCEYVSTSKVLSDYQKIIDSEQKIDVITFSGSGEPTLAKNLGAIHDQIKMLTPQYPTLILTNGVHLGDPKVQENLKNFDKVTIKLDSTSEEHLQKINRPADGVHYDSIIESIINFKNQFKGKIEIQIMLMPSMLPNIEKLIKTLKSIGPNLVQLNTPKRPYPHGWYRENRGNHLGIHDHKTSQLETLEPEKAKEIESLLRPHVQELISVYH